MISSKCTPHNISVFLGVVVSTFITFASAKAEPPPGPRDTTYQPFFHALIVPTAPTEKQLVDFLRVQGTQYEPFMNGFGDMSSPQNHCCGRGDCRYVRAVENTDGSYTAYIPHGAYPGANKDQVIVPPNAIIRDTSSLHALEPPSAVLCASADLSNVYCFHPAGQLTENDSPLYALWLTAMSTMIDRRDREEKRPVFSTNLQSAAFTQ